MHDCVAEPANCEEVAYLVAIQVREVLPIAVDEIGNVGAVNDLFERFLGLERLPNLVVATPIVLAEIIAEQTQPDPVRAVRIFEHPRHIRSHRVAVGVVCVGRPILVRKAALSHDRSPSVSVLCGSPLSAAAFVFALLKRLARRCLALPAALMEGRVACGLVKPTF